MFIAAGWSSSVARWAHNPEVASSNLAPATRQGPQINLGAFVLCGLGSGPCFQRDFRYLACIGGLWGGGQAYGDRITGITKNTGLNIRIAFRSNSSPIGRRSRGATPACLVCGPLTPCGQAPGERAAHSDATRLDSAGSRASSCPQCVPACLSREGQGLARMHPRLIRAQREG